MWGEMPRERRLCIHMRILYVSLIVCTMTRIYMDVIIKKKNVRKFGHSVG